MFKKCFNGRKYWSKINFPLRLPLGWVSYSSSSMRGARCQFLRRTCRPHAQYTHQTDKFMHTYQMKIFPLHRYYVGILLHCCPSLVLGIQSYNTDKNVSHGMRWMKVDKSQYFEAHAILLFFIDALSINMAWMCMESGSHPHKSQSITIAMEF